MSLVFFVWLADVVGVLSNLLMFGGVVTLLILLGASAIMRWDFKVDVSYLKWSVPLLVFLVLFGALLPSKQGTYQIAAALGAVETVQYLQQSDDAKRIAGKSIQAIEKMLDDAIKEDKK